MRIKTSGQTHTIFRYAGQIEGKTLETKIGAVPVGTKPDDVPTALADNLTPNELRELAELLRCEQVELARKMLSSLAADIESAAGLITAETLEEQAAEKLAAALSRCKVAVGRVQRSRQSVAAPDVQTPAEEAT
jgi:cytochrome c553